MEEETPWEIYIKTIKNKKDIIKYLKAYNEKWELNKKNIRVKKELRENRERVIHEQKRDLLITHIKVDKKREELERESEEIRRRTENLKREAEIIKRLIEKFSGKTPSVNEENKKSIKLAEKLLETKLREIRIYELMMTNLSRFMYITNEDVLDALKDEMLILKEEARRIKEEINLFPESENRGRLIIIMQKLEEIRRNHFKIRDTVKREIIIRDKNMIGLIKLFYRYYKKEPVAKAILDAIKPEKQEKYLKDTIKINA